MVSLASNVRAKVRRGTRAVKDKSRRFWWKAAAYLVGERVRGETEV